MACPMAAGVAALARSQTPSMSANAVEGFIESNADDKGDPGRDDEYGWGRINAYKSPTAPTITSISPSSGKADTEVTINGILFGSTQGTSKVSFEDVQVTEYISWSDTEIKFTVPSKPIGNYHVTVKTASGTSNWVTFFMQGNWDIQDSGAIYILMEVSAVNANTAWAVELEGLFDRYGTVLKLSLIHI